MPGMPISVEGSCHCGGVQYRAEGAIRISALCHCINCTHNRGVSPAHLILIEPEDSVQVTEGEDLLTTFAGEKGTVTRVFCRVCGTVVHQGPPGGGFRAVLPATFKCGRPLPRDYWPKAHFNYESRTFDWDDALPKHKTWPGQGEVDNQGNDK